MRLLTILVALPALVYAGCKTRGPQPRQPRASQAMPAGCYCQQVLDHGPCYPKNPRS